MKCLKLFIFVLLSIAFLGCSPGLQFEKKSNDPADNFAAAEVADSLANPENGVTQEFSDNIGLINGDAGESLSGDIQAGSNSPQTSTVTIIYSNELDSHFAWNPSFSCYERTIANLTVIKSNFTGTIDSVNVELQFFTSADATGFPVQLDSGKPKNLANNPNIHSMKYSRTYSGTLTNIARNITRNISVSTNLVITEINDGVDGVLVSGSRTENVSVVNGNITGNWTLIHTFENVNASREISDGTRITTYQGTVDVSFNGTWSGPKGKKTITKTALITFNKQRTVTVSIDGSTVTVDITTGNIS